MPYLTDLATACRKSGLPVVEVSGWQSRGHGSMTAVETIACHHTATSAAASGNYPSLGIVRDGRSDLPGPLAHLGLGRDGTVYVIAAGVCYHAGETQLTRQDNWHAIGIEAEHNGISPWPESLIDAYAALCAALAEHYDVPLANVQGHKEICAPAGRKIDPNFDMAAFRGRVADIEEDEMKPADFDTIRTIIRDEIDTALGNVGAERIDNPGDTGPKSRSLSKLLFDQRTALTKIARETEALGKALGAASRSARSKS